MQITLNPKHVSTCMLIIIATLAALHITQLITYFIIDNPEEFDFILLLDFDLEANLPSVYSMIAIMLCSTVLFLIASAKKKTQQLYHFHWLLLGWIFLFLGIDEGAALHEEIGDLMELVITASGFLYFPWVIPYTILVALLAACYFRFLLQLPKETMVRFIIAAALFLTGAVGFEMISANQADLHGTDSILYSVLYTIEELCEMIAIVIFLHTLLKYYQREVGTLTIRIAD